MAVPTRPSISIEWASASGAEKNVIPQSMDVANMTDDAAASWEQGFPSQTSIAHGQGGLYVSRLDFNGVLNTFSQYALYQQAGGMFAWDSSRDYPAGARILGSDGEIYIAVQDNGPSTTPGAVNPVTAPNETVWKPFSRSIADIIYPVGSIYISANSTSPATLFGGAWTQIQGRFLLGVSNSYTAESTGGSATHTLTVGEMPAHKHTTSLANAGAHTHTASTANAGAHTHTASTGGSGAHTHTASTGGAGGHTHTATTASAGAHTHNVKVPKNGLTLTAASAGAHTHTRGSMNITASGFMGEKAGTSGDENASFKSQATGALYYSGTKKCGSHGGLDQDDYTGFFDASRSGAWTGSTSSNGAHTHTVTGPTAATTLSGASLSAGAHTHTMTVGSVSNHTHTVSVAEVSTHTHTVSVQSAGSHNHATTIESAGAHTHTVNMSNAGGGAAFSIMPPYLAVYMWQRTS